MNDDELALEAVPDLPEEDDEAADAQAADASPPGGGMAGGIAEAIGRIVPLSIVVGLVSAVAVAVAVVLLVSVTTGGGSTAVSAADEVGHASEIDAGRGDAPAGSGGASVPRSSRVPLGPAASPTPVRWERRDNTWIGHGVAGPNRGELLKPDKFLLLDNRSDVFTLTTRFSVLTASGDGAPLWGVALSYLDERNFLFLESFTVDRRPYMQLSWNKDGEGGPIGERVAVPGVDFWGRDGHDLRVTVDDRQVRGWIDGQAFGLWSNLKPAPGGRKGLVVWFSSVMRFEDLTIK